ncbi:MAG: hypothetical protein CL946_12180 [Ectothiorhodospiraceae bacterium]|nr:hypothetical protein [Ectothiorhodospiraceae bacterium]
MILESIRLQNIKSFVDETVYFAPGINIIAGRNGAGKSTIIESAGLALFNYWPSKFKDGNARVGFLRKEESEGSIALSVSNGDRRYTIVCNLNERKRKNKASTTEYERILYDENGEELANSAGRKAEFQDDIRAHILGASRITDEQLFENIIGTQQGAFDDPFTGNESDRRKLFEKILGVEDFQKFEQQFKGFVRYADSRVESFINRLGEYTDVEQAIEQARETLTGLKTNHAAAQKQLAESKQRREAAEKKYEALGKKKDAFERLVSNRESLTKQREMAGNTHTKASTDLENATKAATRMQELQPGYEAYNNAEDSLIKLRQEKEDREKLQKSIDEKRREYETKSETLKERLKGVSEREDSLRITIKELEEKVSQIKEDERSLKSALEEMKNDLETASAQARVASRLRDYASQLHTVLQDRETVIANLRVQFREIRQELDAIPEREQVGEFAELFEKITEGIKQLKAEGDREEARSGLNTESLVKNADTLCKQASTKESELSNTFATKKAEMKALGDSLKQINAELTKQTQELRRLKKGADDAEKELKERTDTWKSDSAAYTEAMKKYEGLDKDIEKCEQQKAQHKKAFDGYLQVRSEAEKVAMREKDAKEAKAALDALTKQLQDIETELERAKAEYSSTAWEQARSAYNDSLESERNAAKEEAKSAAELRAQEEVLAEAEKRLDKKRTLEHNKAEAEKEYEFYSLLSKSVVQDLARRVGATIVLAVSEFANELYRRIAPEQSALLVWDPQSYGISLKGEQGEITGKELSGGQLMGVSLAIKLALIKWYSQCGLGFLDEPTTHLDSETRRHLSDVIQSLHTLTSEGAWFDQLFIISHVEALAGAGSRVELLLENGASRVVQVD